VKKLAILGIVALLLVMGLAVVAPAPVGAQTTWHVYPGDSIQAAIDAASTDDTIIVHEGTYTEDLTISAAKTNLELKPADGDAVTIQGVATVLETNYPLCDPNINIIADGVKVHGFTIEHPDTTPGTNYASGMVVGAENVEISDNAFQVAHWSQGIQTWRDANSPNDNIAGLNIHDNAFTHKGDPVGGAHGYVGVWINHSTVTTGTVTIQDNVFTGDIIQGIYSERDNSTIQGNSLITDMGTTASHFGIGIGDYDGRAQSNVLITDNTVEGFQWGMRIGRSGQTLTNISVHKNTVDDNGIGIQVRSSDTDVAIHHNAVTGNDGDGISLAGDTDSIHHNTVTGNGGDGISVAGDSDSIHHNTVTDNGGYGIHLTATSHDNTVHHNTLSGNTAGEINNEGTNNKVFKN